MSKRMTSHFETSGWGGVPGQCGVECVCGVTFDGFDSVAEAAALLEDHVARANRWTSRVWQAITSRLRRRPDLEY